MNEQTEDFLSIDTWIKKGYSFAIYRAPRENNLHIIIQYGGDVYVATDIKELNGKKGFVIAPFNNRAVSPEPRSPLAPLSCTKEALLQLMCKAHIRTPLPVEPPTQAETCRPWN